MLITAVLAIGGIWFESTMPEAYFKAVGTCFIIGLANLLLWLPLMVYHFYQKL